MKRIGLFLLGFLFILSIEGQTVRVVLKSRVNMWNLPYDSVQIRNIRTNQKITKIYPDTVLFTSTVGVENYEYQNPAFDLFLNAQNPFEGSTQVVLNTVVKQPVTLSLYDVSGKLCYENSYTPEPGVHTFSVSPPVEGFYILQAKTSNLKKSVKLIQIGNGSENQMISMLYSEVNQEFIPENPSKDESAFFVIGDSLAFTCWKNENTKSGVVKMNQNGYIYFNIFPIMTNVFSLRGVWKTLPMNYNFEPHITTVTTIPYENYVNFISDSVLSTYRNLPFNPEYSTWDFFSEVGQSSYYFYRLDNNGFEIIISEEFMMYYNYHVNILTNYFLKVDGSVIGKSDKFGGEYDYFIKTP
ncbi:MAG: hypothetical protein CVU02_01670 [Bacteroidetes bacterium HGW-Bacteroidetes-19]|nr:MAG: hypothetical protein CVU02_01670 [Bacteroidetes bacterium HGW-Bacteroidetes-19]